MGIKDEFKIFDDNLIKQFYEVGKSKIDYWDIRSGLNSGITIDFTNQKSKEISSYETIECGIRTFINGGWGFCVLKTVTRETLLNGFLKAIKLAHNSESLCKNKFKMVERDPLIRNYEIGSKKRLDNISIEEKIEIVKYHEKVASDFSIQTNTLTKGINILTIFAQLDGYQAQTIQFFINVDERATELILFVNGIQENQSATVQFEANELINITVDTTAKAENVSAFIFWDKNESYNFTLYLTHKGEKINWSYDNFTFIEEGNWTIRVISSDGAGYQPSMVENDFFVGVPDLEIVNISIFLLVLIRYIFLITK